MFRLSQAPGPTQCTCAEGERPGGLSEGNLCVGMICQRPLQQHQVDDRWPSASVRRSPLSCVFRCSKASIANTMSTRFSAEGDDSEARQCLRQGLPAHTTIRTDGLWRAPNSEVEMKPGRRNDPRSLMLSTLCRPSPLNHPCFLEHTNKSSWREEMNNNKRFWHHQ